MATINTQQLQPQQIPEAVLVILGLAKLDEIEGTQDVIAQRITAATLFPVIVSTIPYCVPPDEGNVALYQYLVQIARRGEQGLTAKNTRAAILELTELFIIAVDDFDDYDTSRRYAEMLAHFHEAYPLHPKEENFHVPTS